MTDVFDAGDDLDLHALIREVWERILTVPVSDDADFFRLGGSSLHAMSITSGVQAALGVRPRLRVLFDHPGFGDYAREVSALIQERSR
jgi:hypothetical protein